MKNKQLFTSNKKDWETPQWLFDELNQEFNFDLDVCANEYNTKCNLYISKDLDCLKIPWTTPRLPVRDCFMNPPYGRKIGMFVRKAYEESMKGCNVVCLLPARTDPRWWWDWCLKANEIRFIKGRLKFGKAANSAPFPSAVVIFLGSPAPPVVKWVDYKRGNTIYR